MLEGYLIALANLDEFIRIIRGSREPRRSAGSNCSPSSSRGRRSSKSGILIRDEARLVDGRYAFSERQANAILELRLYQLTGLERDKIKSEYDELDRDDQGPARHSREGIARLGDHQGGAARDSERSTPRPRLTEIVPDEGEIDIEDLIANEGVHHHASRTTASSSARAVSAYRAQRRGGKGVIGMTTREGATRGGRRRFHRASLHRHARTIT